jgi:hypothetical protein
MTTKKQYMLRTCKADMTSHGGFKWPRKGPVVCPDWSPNPECGHGLHGALSGCGDGSLLSWDADAVWMVVRIDGKIVDLGGKVKTDRAYVVYAGDRKTATDKIRKLCGNGPIIGGMATAGYSGTATAGYSGTATAGDRGTATAGDSGTATAGDGGTATAGDSGTATAGYSGTATAGDRGTATAGDGGTATAGYKGTATAGYYGTATAGYKGTATAGYKGTATAGYSGRATAGEYGTATAGYSGIINIKWYDDSRYRIAVGYVGEDGIEAGKKYRCEGGKFVEVKNE